MPDLSYWGSDKIDPNREGSAVLTCVNHPNLRWHTKNIGYIGVRSIFFSGGVLPDGSHQESAPWTPQLDDIRYQDGAAIELGIFQRWSNTVAMLVDKGYALECPCPMRDLVLVPAP